MSFGKMFAKRSTVCFFMVCFIFLFCCLRLYTVATGPYLEIQQNQSSLRLEINRPRGTIYDCNMLPLNNQQVNIMAAISPTPRAVIALSTELRGDERLPAILDRLATGKPVVCSVDKRIECDGIVCTEIAVAHNSSQLAEHTVGYIDSTGHGVTGLEQAFDELLYSDETIDAVFKTDGLGRIMEGEEIEITGKDSVLGNSVITTIDINIQQAAEQAALDIERGAVVVCDAKTGEIRALVSRPSFDCTRVSDFLNRSDSPLLNRCFSSYSVGSVFKPCVAAAGIEAGKESFVAECMGGTEISDRIFRCHYKAGHGKLDVSGALAFSCNVFFYRFALAMGGRAVYNMASSLNFGNSISLADGIQTSVGTLANLDSLKTQAALANLSIGQGELTLSPISMLTLYCAIASDGCYYLPSLVTATVKGGMQSEYKTSSPTRVMSGETAKKLRTALTRVISEGTGKTAAPSLCTAAGKTATAQTGTYNKNGVEITNGWFCGFFPATDPEYVVVIMEEDAIGGDVAPIFAKVADNIFRIKNTNEN